MDSRFEYINIVDDFYNPCELDIYFADNSIEYSLKVSTSWEDEVSGIDWGCVKRPVAVFIYAVKISNEEVVFLSIKFPSIRFCRPKRLSGKYYQKPRTL